MAKEIKKKINSNLFFSCIEKSHNTKCQMQTKRFRFITKEKRVLPKLTKFQKYVGRYVII